MRGGPFIFERRLIDDLGENVAILPLALTKLIYRRIIAGSGTVDNIPSVNGIGKS